MQNILNSDFTQWLLKWGLSKSSALVGSFTVWLITQLNLASFIPAEDLTIIEGAVKGFLIAVIAAFYAWLAKRQLDGVKILQAVHNEATPGTPLDVDGIAGNKTVAAVAKASDITPAKAVKLAENAPAPTG